jgi:hypothetical protein
MDRALSHSLTRSAKKLDGHRDPHGDGGIARERIRLRKVPRHLICGSFERRFQQIRAQAKVRNASCMSARLS